MDEQTATLLSNFFGLEGRQWPERAVLMVDRALGMVVVVQPQPCDCAPVAGAVAFPADAADCTDPAKADAAIFRYDFIAQDPRRSDALSPEDLNNIACYLLWQSDASPESAKAAHELLRRARARTADGDPLRPVIDGNLGKFKPITPGVPRSLSALQELAYSVKRPLANFDDWIIEKIGPEARA